MSSPNLTPIERGGLAQIVAKKGTGLLWSFAFFAKKIAMEQAPPLSIWMADEGFVYPAVLADLKIPLTHLLLVKAPSSNTVWQLGCEAIQTGLFEWVFLRASKPCQAVVLRRLQLAAERFKAKVFLLCQTPLPQWPIKVFLEIDESYENLLLSNPSESWKSRRGLLKSHTENTRP